MEAGQSHGSAAPSSCRSSLRRAAALTLLVAAWPQTSLQFCVPGTWSAQRSRSQLLQTQRRARRRRGRPTRFRGVFEALPEPEDPPFPPGIDDPLPWPEETAEIMIDAHSVIPWYWSETAKIEEDLNLRHDMFTFWPARIAKAGQALLSRFGISRPPSAWSPIIVVFDLPDAAKTINGHQVKRYRRIARQGPVRFNNVTLAFSQSYVDTSARELYRCDREIMYMLEMLMRPYPRRQILVTEDVHLARCTKLPGPC
ncbi:MEGF8 [Symbiodinium natans]|uniref:MEGF8 protein n=1 Tax=Symbiodinium natans TaxID=878477 RepID=A0A812UHW4_9DINO|nr:MEGF8 [Symbiodinium natans]